MQCYEKKDGKFVATKGCEGPANASLERVTFTRVPGLLYVYWLDTKLHEEELKGELRQQVSARRNARVAVTNLAKGYERLELPGDSGEIANGCYRLTEELSVPFSTREGSWKKLELPEKLRTIYVFEKSIVCQTESGWSVNEPNGKLIKHFQAKGINAVWWDPPTFDEKGCILHARFGADAKDFRFNVAAGRLDQIEKRADGE